MLYIYALYEENKMFNDKKKIIICIAAILVVTVLFIIFVINRNQNKNIIDLNSLVGEENQTEESSENLNNENLKSEENSEKGTNAENSGMNTEKQNSETIVIHITGEVKKEGVIYLEEGARIIDAIKEAGGETKQADLSQVNLAYELQDGQKVYIPNKNEKITEYIVDNSNENLTNNQNTNKSDSGSNGKIIKININTATLAELDNLPGIGPSTAQKIIEYREKNGKFKKIEDIQNVKGIGEAKYEDIKEKITV
jgi:competence protein ComEA